jgi:hypothetical protein
VRRNAPMQPVFADDQDGKRGSASADPLLLVPDSLFYVP